MYQKKKYFIHNLKLQMFIITWIYVQQICAVTTGVRAGVSDKISQTVSTLCNVSWSYFLAHTCWSKQKILNCWIRKFDETESHTCYNNNSAEISLSLFKDGDVINLSALRAQFTNERWINKQ